MSVNFSPIFEKLLREVEQLAKTTLTGYVKDAKKDGNDALNKMKGRLEKWTNQLAAGAITKSDFEFLIQGQKDLLELIALKQAGIAAIKADEFKNGVLQIITSTVFSVLKI